MKWIDKLTIKYCIIAGIIVFILGFSAGVGIMSIPDNNQNNPTKNILPEFVRKTDQFTIGGK